MEIQFDDNIKRARYPLLTWLTSRQAFWVSVAVILACIFLSFATNSFATSNNIFNVARNFTFVAIIALGMTIVIITGGIDLSVGSMMCFSAMVTSMVMSGLSTPGMPGASLFVHLAAVTDAASSFDSAALVEKVNFAGTERVAQACAEAGTKLIFVSTTSVYGMQQTLVREDCPVGELRPQSPCVPTTCAHLG
jgi:ABC-type glucose/galactose transport system permease subunit